MKILSTKQIDLPTFRNMISKLDGDSYIYWAMYKMNKYGNTFLFEYDKDKVKDFDFGNPKEDKIQITILNTKDSSDEHGTFVSCAQRTFEKENFENKEYYYVYFFSQDMLELACFMNEFDIDIHEGKIELYNNDMLDANNIISLYQNGSDIKFGDDQRFNIKRNSNMLYILCKNTCISKKAKDPKKKPKFRKYSDTLIDAFASIEGVKDCILNKILKDTPKEQVYLDTYKINSLRRKYDSGFLNNVILFSVNIEENGFKVSHMYFVYCKSEPYDTTHKDYLTISRDEFKYIKSELKKVFTENEEERTDEEN